MNTRIFLQMLRVQWNWMWGAVLLISLAAFAVPILSVQQTTTVMSNGPLASPATAGPYFLGVMERYSVLYTLLAGLAGLVIATMSWSPDHRGRHVYSLSLPIERWRFVLFRFGSGLILALAPAVLLLIGALLAVATVAIPDGLSPYPLQLAVRFALAALVAYSLFFAISSGTTRTAAVVLAPIAVLIAADVLLAASGFPLRLVENSLGAVFEWPGVLEIFTGRWLLIDV
jgi:hypothetical protein